jgi:hypothetical protein
MDCSARSKDKISFLRRVLFPAADVNETSRDSGSGGHGGRNKMGSAFEALPTFEITVGRRGASFARG